jgi:hypothetical protein
MEKNVEKFEGDFYQVYLNERTVIARRIFLTDIFFFGRRIFFFLIDILEIKAIFDKLHSNCGAHFECIEKFSLTKRIWSITDNSPIPILYNAFYLRKAQGMFGTTKRIFYLKVSSYEKHYYSKKFTF